MNFGRSFTYIFEDPLWTNKLVMTAVLAVLSLIPLFGLVALAALLGYMVELIANMKTKQPHPMPSWNNLERHLSVGAPLLVAYLIYNVPVLVLFSCVFTGPGFLGGGSLGSGLSGALICCLVPLILVSTAITWSLLAVSITRYATDNRTNILYQFGISWAALTANAPAIAQWAVFALGVNIVFSLLIGIPCIGWLAIVAMIVPVHAYLLGQLAIIIDPARARR